MLVCIHSPQKTILVSVIGCETQSAVEANLPPQALLETRGCCYFTVFGMINWIFKLTDDAIPTIFVKQLDAKAKRVSSFHGEIE